MAAELQIEGQKILVEEYDSEYDPNTEDLKEYCETIGLDYDNEKDLLHIAREAIKAPIPRDWRPIETENGDLYYFNFKTGESSWEHPSDKFYKELLDREREKKRKQVSMLKGGSKKGLNLLPGASSALAGVHNLPPLKASKLEPLALLKGSHGQQQVKQQSPGHSGRSGLQRPPMSSSHDRVSSVSPSTAPHSILESPENVLASSAGASYLKSTSPKGTSSEKVLLKPRSPAPFKLGEIASQFEEEEESEDDSQQLVESDDVNRFDKQFNLGGFYNESSDHSVSDEIAKVTGLDAYSDEPEPAKHQKEAVGMRQVQAPPLLEDSDSFHQMRMYAEQMEQLSPPMVSPATTPGNPYLKAPPTHVLSSSSKQSEVSSGVSSGVNSPRRPSSSYGRSAHHHVIPTQIEDYGRDSNEEEDGDSDVFGGRAVSVENVLSPVIHASPPHTNIVMLPSGRAGQLELGERPVQQVPSTKQTDRHILIRSSGTRAEQEVAAKLEVAHQEELNKLKKSHSLELANLAKKYEQELSDSEHKLKADLESRLADMRGKLAAHLLEEEQRIKTEETKCFEEIKKKLQEEQDEEEAQLYEEKTNAIIKLKQQLASKRLNEEEVIKTADAASIKELKKTLQDKRAQKEANLRKEHAREMESMIQECKEELAQERAKIDEDHAGKLAALREEQDEGFQEKCTALSDEIKKKMAEYEAVMSKEKETKMAELRSKLDSEVESERQKLEDLEQQKGTALENLQHEFEKMLVEERERLEAEQADKLGNLTKDYNKLFEANKGDLEKKHEKLIAKLKKEQGLAVEELRKVNERIQSELENQKAALKQSRKELEEEENALQQQKEKLSAECKALEEKVRENGEADGHLPSLHRASHHETEDLLLKQQEQLQLSIDKEKENLDSLRKSCREVQSELIELKRQKEKIEKAVLSLQEEKASFTSSISGLKKAASQEQSNLKKLKEQRRKAESKKNKAAPSVAVGVQVCLPPPFVDHAPPSDGPHPQGFAVSSPQSTLNSSTPITKTNTTETILTTNSTNLEVPTLNFEDLNSPIALPIKQAPDVPNGRRSKVAKQSPNERYSAAGSARVLTPGAEQEEDTEFSLLHKQLSKEDYSYNYAKQVLERHHKTLTKRKAALKKAEVELDRDLKRLNSSRYSKAVQDIQTSLHDESKSISEMEEQLSASNDLLDMKKKHIKELEQSLLSKLKSSPAVTGSEDESFDVSTYNSPKSYLKTLREKVGREKHQQVGIARDRHRRLGRFTTLSSESSGVSSTSLSLSSDDTEGEESLHPALPYHKDHKTPRPHKGSSNSLASMKVLSSLEQINGKLWQVMDKLNEQSSFANTQNLVHQGVSLSPESSYGLIGTAGVFKHSDKWAHTVRSHGHSRTVEDELRDRWNTYLEPAYFQQQQRALREESIRGQLPVAPSTPHMVPSISTEERVQKEKDWLREFRKDIALSSSHHSSPTSPSHNKIPNASFLGTSDPKHSLRFILDKHNNVKLQKSYF